MKNKKEFTLAFKLYTDGDLHIENWEEIGLTNYVDNYTYSIVISWDIFDYAKDEALKILNKIVENLKGRDFDLERILESIKKFIKRLESLTLEGLLTLYYGNSIYQSSGGNQELDIQFVYGEAPDYIFREHILLDRLEDYIKTLPDGDIKYSLINLSKGRKYNEGVNKIYQSELFIAYSGDPKILSDFSNDKQDQIINDILKKKKERKK